MRWKGVRMWDWEGLSVTAPLAPDSRGTDISAKLSFAYQFRYTKRFKSLGLNIVRQVKREEEEGRQGRGRNVLRRGERAQGKGR